MGLDARQVARGKGADGSAHSRSFRSLAEASLQLVADVLGGVYTWRAMRTLALAVAVLVASVSYADQQVLRQVKSVRVYSDAPIVGGRADITVNSGPAFDARMAQVRVLNALCAKAGLLKTGREVRMEDWMLMLEFEKTGNHVLKRGPEGYTVNAHLERPSEYSHGRSPSRWHASVTAPTIRDLYIAEQTLVAKFIREWQQANKKAK